MTEPHWTIQVLDWFAASPWRWLVLAWLILLARGGSFVKINRGERKS